MKLKMITIIVVVKNVSVKFLLVIPTESSINQFLGVFNRITVYKS